MGIGCRRDPLEANMWYVKAAEAGDERAKHRLAAIRDAVAGGDPMEVAKGKGRRKKAGVTASEAASPVESRSGAQSAVSRNSGHSNEPTSSAKPKVLKSANDKDCVVM
jgi:TPR repeat protein